MRKVTFVINDLEWMKKYYKLSDEQFNNIFASEKPFKCIYTLYGEGKEYPDVYCDTQRPLLRSKKATLRY